MMFHICRITSYKLELLCLLICIKLCCLQHSITASAIEEFPIRTILIEPHDEPAQQNSPQIQNTAQKPHRTLAPNSTVVQHNGQSSSGDLSQFDTNAQNNRIKNINNSEIAISHDHDESSIINRTAIRRKQRLFTIDDDEEENQNQLSSKNLNHQDVYANLRQKAKYFGQTGAEHQKVHDILKQLNIFVSSQHRVNGDQEILIEYGNNSDADMDISQPIDVGNDTTTVDIRQRTPNTSDISTWADERQRDFRPRPPSKDYYQSKIKQAERRSKGSTNGRFGDADDDEENPPGVNKSGPLRQAAMHGAEERGRHFEGDIVLTLDQAEEMYDRVLHANDRRKRRKFIATQTRRWNPDKPIEYSFDGSHTIRERNLIELALEHWQNVTCLNFARKDDQPHGNRIVFTDVDGCASNVGRNPIEDVQFVSLASECIRLGVIAHEVAHALGFWHEQSRPDRDTFVNVKWGNIETGSSGQFLKERRDDVDDEGIPYDYGSIMHYRSKAFSKSEALFTITTNVEDYQRTIGQRDQLSFNDIRLMNKVYCSHKCITKLACLRGGYTDPRKCDRCRCPDGFTGKLCEKIMGGYGATCGGEIPMNNLFYYFNSPNYPQNFDEGQECSWLLRAPLGQIIQLEFVGSAFELYCKLEHSLCMDYVEIRNTSDFANTGMRFCCYSTPKGFIYSETNDLLVLFRSFYRSGVGFKARARAINRAERA